MMFLLKLIFFPLYIVFWFFIGIVQAVMKLYK